jgi:hypothetical protein
MMYYDDYDDEVFFIFIAIFAPLLFVIMVLLLCSGGSDKATFIKDCTAQHGKVIQVGDNVSCIIGGVREDF